ncbi:hypothetical protein WQ54_06445 [Bacillus sp. SA1-12]|nr:hypothetical protein WQ54_06445 [Bacillus sp. SA1-12]
MKNLVFILFLIFLLPGTIHAQTTTVISYPCSLVLYPVKDTSNALGTALIAKVKKPFTNTPQSPVRERQSVGIYADWLPLPSSYGDYDQYEGFAQVPDVISWRFKLVPVKEAAPSWFGGTPWVGKFDEISLEIPVNTRVEVRLSNSKRDKLGPVVLQNSLQGCGK